MEGVRYLVLGRLAFDAYYDERSGQTYRWIEWPIKHLIQRCLENHLRGLRK